MDKIYPDLVKVFYANLKFNNGILKSSVKGVEMEITRQTWKDVAGLRQMGVQVQKGEITEWMNLTKSNISTNVCAIKVSKLEISMWEDFVWRKGC